MMRSNIPVHHLARVGGATARRCKRVNTAASLVHRVRSRQHASSSSGPKHPRPSAPKPLPYKPGRPGPKQQGASSSPESSGTSSSQAQPVSELMRTRWFPLFGVGAATVCMGYFIASLAVQWTKHPPEHYEPGCEPQAPTGRPSIQSPVEFDLHLDKSEWRFGITKLRRKLSAAARGHVLEVAVGTGRNLEFYDWAGITGTSSSDTDSVEKNSSKERNREMLQKLEKVRWDRSKLQDLEYAEVRSYTGLDISPAMLDIALRRMWQVVPGLADTLPKRPLFHELASQDEAANNACVSLLDNKIRILTSDAQSSLPSPPPPPPPSAGKDQKYDTIVQTFGLCSVRDPVRLLANMAAALKPETGRIVLLEHGRSSWWELVNRLLDRSARGHFERFGCWWNRDIERVVREAEGRVPGLEVVKLERPGLLTLGTHIWIELRLAATAPTTTKLADSSPEEKTDEKLEQQQQQQQRSGGRFGTGFGSSSVLSVKKPSEPKDPKF